MKDDGAVTAQESTGESPQKRTLREVLSTVGVLLSAMVLAFGLIRFVFQTYQVSGMSMDQTLHDGEHLLVWKLPRTWSRITGHTYMPARGDIIILDGNAAVGAACYTTQDSQLVKRLVGLPGDHVVVAGGVLTIYNRQHPRGFRPDSTLPYHNQITETTNHNVNVTLGANQIFVVGDNRLNSCDSRYFGPLNAGQIVGKLVIRVLPVNKIKVF